MTTMIAGVCCGAVGALVTGIAILIHLWRTGKWPEDDIDIGVSGWPPDKDEDYGKPS